MERLALAVAVTWTFFQGTLAGAGQPNLKCSADLGWKEEEIVVKLSVPLSTKTSPPNSTFSAQIISPDEYAKNTATVEGRVAEIQPAKKRDRSRIVFEFDKLIVNGGCHAIQAQLKPGPAKAVLKNSKGAQGVDEEGSLISATPKKQRIGGTVLGSLAGAAIGGLARGGQGAAVGAVAGAAAGFLVTTAFTATASDIEFFPGSEFILIASDRGRKR